MQEKKKSLWSSLVDSFVPKKDSPEEPEHVLEHEQPPPGKPSPPVKFGPHWVLDIFPGGATSNLISLWNGESEQRILVQSSIVLDRMPEGKLLPLSVEQMGNEIARLRVSLEGRSASRLKLVRDQEHQAENSAKLPPECLVHISQNAMLAWMLFYPPVGQKLAVTIDMATSALRKAGVSTGLDSQFLGTMVKKQSYFELFPVAWGTPPREGEDGRIFDYFPREYSKELVLDERGNVDYREQSYVRTLQRGDVICDIIPPQLGTDGIQVSGKVVKAQVIQPARPPMGKNTTISPDGLQMIASVDGHLEFTGKYFQVKPILEIKGDVDYSSGNINFFGDVHVRGDVRENFTVRATGSVTIDGLVEAATVEADGNVIITKGVLGDNKAMIRSRKTVRAKYLENCVVYAGESVFADCIINSQVYTDSRISVLTGRGTIIGGCISAAELVEATVIGSNAGRRTEIILGRMPNVELERSDNAVEIKQLQAQLEVIGREISYLLPHQDSAENAKQLGKLRLNKSVMELKVEKLSRRMVELEEMAPDLAVCRLRCSTMFATTNLTIGKTTRLINTSWVNCMAYYDMEQREINFTGG